MGLEFLLHVPIEADEALLEVPRLRLLDLPDVEVDELMVSMW